MKEADLIAATDAALGAPVTVERIRDDLKQLGVREGETLLVHSALSSLGWINGGPEALVRSLIAVLGESGTLVMPAHSGDRSDPEAWEHPPVPDSWKTVIRSTMPPFDPGTTPTRGIGAVPEFFRKYPGVRRSAHPMDSFTALGPQAKIITADHQLREGLGEASPLGRLYELDARVLLIGCDHGSNTSLHLAEHRADWPGKKSITQGAPLDDGRGGSIWTEYDELDYDADDFARCGEAFERAADPSDIRRGKVALAECRLMRQRAVVDFAVQWFTANRPGAAQGSSEAK